MHWECLFVRSLLGPGDCLLGKSVSDMSVEGTGVMWVCFFLSLSLSLSLSFSLSLSLYVSAFISI